MISRATSVYIITLLVFGAGLWAILSFGSILLRAPNDLAGAWELYPPGDAQGDPVQRMIVEQSGRYLRVVVDGKPVSLQLTEKIHEMTTGPDQIVITLANPTAELRLTGAPDAEEYDLEARGIIDGTWRAVRTTRTYAKRTADIPPIRTAVAQ